ncbi:ClpP/crotonase [Jaminaea rosea]|uniref:ClpP/crotonase n=1 Tax=Jaminaea rosea TaxID=1569628 RepID=A0A316USL3_9BASI|nr:ClpP/crotonase [Jaminaea rosea]PWN26125.1 ClpP/crotonase [Jaminaea rosea]
MSLDTSRYPLGFKSTVPGSTDDLVSLSLTHHSSTPAPIFVLTLLSAQTPDNRLTPQFLTALHSALKHVEEVWDNVLSSTPHGAGLVITGTLQGKTAKFFSNGLDFESAIGDPEFFDRYLFPVYESLLTFPVPVVASIGGHAFAAGFGLAAACDGAVMGKKGYLCMNEIDFGAQIPPGLWAPLSTRIHLPQHKARVVLQGERFPGAEALKAGFVDVHLPDAEPNDVLAKSVEMAASWAHKSKAGVWGMNKRVIHAQQLEVLRQPYGETIAKL